ncbi:MAG TPA: hypothetical protein VF378_04355 [Geothrix sp.]
MRTLIGLLLPGLLIAQEPALVHGAPVGLQRSLGMDPASRIQLAPPGCWDQLLLGSVSRPAPPARRGTAEATVEVWDFALRESPREVTFGFFLGTLRQRLSKAWELPPSSHQALELSEIMLSDPSSPQKLDLTKVKSLQDRFNVLPPNGSPVK